MTSAAQFLRRLWRTDAPLTAVGLAMVGVLVAALAGLVTRSTDDHGSARMAQAGEIRRLDCHLCAQPRVGIHLPARMAEDAPIRRPGHRGYADAGDCHHQSPGVARYGKPLQRPHGARRRAVRRDGVRHRGADAVERRRCGCAVAPALRAPCPRHGAAVRVHAHDCRRLGRRHDDSPDGCATGGCAHEPDGARGCAHGRCSRRRAGGGGHWMEPRARRPQGAALRRACTPSRHSALFALVFAVRRRRVRLVLAAASSYTAAVRAPALAGASRAVDPAARRA